MINSADTIIHSVDAMILSRMRKLKQEERYPSQSADESDDLIKTLTQQIVKLRSIRMELEDILAD